MPAPERITVNRSLVGWLALGCVGGAAASFFLEADQVNIWQSILTRVGIVLTALWMALPKDGTLGNWANVSVSTLVGIVLAIFVVARNPRQSLPMLIVVAVIGYFLRPREKRRPPRDFSTKRSTETGVDRQ